MEFISKMKNMKTAIVSGATGQDGSFLIELLLEKGYKVIGLVRRASTPNTYRIEHLMKLEGSDDECFQLKYWDLVDDSSIRNIIKEYQPDYFFNTAAMSHVAISFQTPIATTEYNAVGVLRILEAIKEIKPDCRFLQCSSSEMFGISPPPQNEDTPMLPQSPYGIAKLYAYHITRLYRNAYGLFACNSICFNHESTRRGINFVTRKITRQISEIVAGERSKVILGNLEAKRDWGSAKDYVQAMEMIINHDKPDDFVIATREAHSIKEYLSEVFDLLGLNWKDYVEISDRYKRPAEVPALLGNPTKIEKIIGWKPKVFFKELVKQMLAADLREKLKINMSDDETINYAKSKLNKND